MQKKLLVNFMLITTILISNSYAMTEETKINNYKVRKDRSSPLNEEDIVLIDKAMKLTEEKQKIETSEVNPDVAASTASGLFDKFINPLLTQIQKFNPF